MTWLVLLPLAFGVVLMVSALPRRQRRVSRQDSDEGTVKVFPAAATEDPVAADAAPEVSSAGKSRGRKLHAGQPGGEAFRPGQHWRQGHRKL